MLDFPSTFFLPVVLGLGVLGLVFLAYLVVKFILPRMDGSSAKEEANYSRIIVSAGISAGLVAVLCSFLFVLSALLLGKYVMRDYSWLPWILFPVVFAFGFLVVLVVVGRRFGPKEGLLSAFLYAAQSLFLVPVVVLLTFVVLTLFKIIR